MDRSYILKPNEVVLLAGLRITELNEDSVKFIEFHDITLIINLSTINLVYG